MSINGGRLRNSEMTRTKVELVQEKGEADRARTNHRWAEGEKSIWSDKAILNKSIIILLV